MAISDKLKQEIEENCSRQKMPNWTSPMLASLTHDHFSDEEWIFERKLDGERCLTYVEGDKRVRLLTRNKKNLNQTYRDLHKAIKQLTSQQMILDGEIVAFDGKVTSFSRLQQRMHDTSGKGEELPVFYYLFDILYYAGYDLTGLPLRTRKQILREAVTFEDPIRFTTHRNTHGEKYFKEACKKGWEGLIAKDGSASYAHSRSSSWLKFKCSRSQEFVIGGFTEPKGSRSGLGAILIGYYDKAKRNQLRYAGKVGTGFDEEMLNVLRKKLGRLERERSPFTQKNIEGKKSEIHWVKPDLVCQAGFTEWTKDGKLRHPRFMGLRRDKAPTKVIREDA